MEAHQGEILEKAIRKSDVSISELARILKTSRRTIYYWFSQRYISKNVIARVGEALMQDFSNEFPDYKSASARYSLNENFIATSFQNPPDKTDIEFWRNKYLYLLEQYNSVMLQKTA